MDKTAKLLLQHICNIAEDEGQAGYDHEGHIRKFSLILLEQLQKYCPAYQLTKESCYMIAEASAYHDIGKISMRDEILMKASRLTKDEYEYMKKHTQKGMQLFDAILKELSPEDEDYPLIQYCKEICLYHHERFDGNGYPYGLKGDDIPISAQVVGLADAYDSLLMEKIYKRAYTKEEAFNRIMEGECGVFSDMLLTIFSMKRMELEEALEKE